MQNDAIEVAEVTDAAEVQVRPKVNVPTVDIMTMTDMPNLEDAAVLPLDLSVEYWTPANAREAKRAIFVKIEEVMMQDINAPEIFAPLPCAFFLEKTEDGVKQFRNGSKRLVAALENVSSGTPLLLTYLGKVRNKTNQFHSDNWSVKPLILSINGNK